MSKQSGASGIRSDESVHNRTESWSLRMNSFDRRITFVSLMASVNLS